MLVAPAIIGHILQAISVGQQLLPVFERATDLIRRLREEDRDEPTLEELDVIAGRISDRQDRIDNA